jgi:hypothetical protein
MCDQAIGDVPPAVCPRCGWELLEVEEAVMGAWSGPWERHPREVSPAVPETPSGAVRVPHL